MIVRARHKWISLTIALAALQGLPSTCESRAADVARPATLSELRWKDLKEKGQVKSGEIAPDEETRKSPLKIASPLTAIAPAQSPAIVPLLDIEAPKIEQSVILLSGDVRYESIGGTAFLEMWTIFPDGSHYFSRTLGTFGPMQSLQGSSGWRPIQLPFEFAKGPNAPRPNRLVVNAVFQGPGTIWLSNMTLAEFDSLQQATTPAGAWWSDATGGWIGGIGGSLFGLLGAVMGVLASRGAARRFVMGSMLAGIAIGAILLGIGIFAITAQQPYGVFYPLLLGGGLFLILCGVGLATFRFRYAALELRRMEALDIGR